MTGADFEVKYSNNGCESMVASKPLASYITLDVSASSNSKVSEHTVGLESSPAELLSSYTSRASRNSAGGWDVTLCRKAEHQDIQRYATKFEAVKAITEFERMEI